MDKVEVDLSIKREGNNVRRRHKLVQIENFPRLGALV